MAKNAVEILIRARDGATKPLGEVTAAVKAVGTEARAGVRPIREYRDELKHQAQQLEEVARSADKTSREYAVAVTELASVKTALQGVNDELRNQETAWDRAGEGLTKVGTRLSLGITAPLTALAAVGVSSAMQLETFSRSLEVLIGDAERAGNVFEELYEFSANVPFDWKTITEGTRVLTAFGVEAEETVATLSRLGDIASGTGSDLTGLAEIYGRVLTTGRVSMQEVNSLALRGVPIYQELAKVIGVSTEEVRELVSQGTLGFPELNAVIENLTDEGGKFFGMMQAQSETTQGRLNKLRDSFEQVTDIIGERLLPTVDALIGHAQQAVEWFVNLDESTQGLFVGLGVALAATGPVLMGIGTLLVQIPKLVAGFQLLRGALLPFLGPAGILAAAVAGYILLNNAMDAGREPRQRAQESFDNLIARMSSYRNELEVTSEAERQAAVEALNRQRRVIEVTIQNQEAFIRSVEADVIAFANKGFFGQLFSFGEANVNLKTLEQADAHLKGLRAELGAIDSSIERIAKMEIPGPKTNIPTVTTQVKDLNDAVTATVELPDPGEAVESWASRFLRSLRQGLENAKSGWRDALEGFGAFTGTAIRDALSVDQPDSPLVEAGKAIVSSLLAGFNQAWPEAEARFAAARKAAQDWLAWQNRPTFSGAAALARLDASSTRRASEFEDSPGLTRLGNLPPAEAGVLWNAVAALVKAKAPVDDIRAAVNRLTEVMPLSNKSVYELTQGMIGLRQSTQAYADNAVKAAQQAADAFNEFPTLIVPPGGLPPAWHLRAADAETRSRALGGPNTFGGPPPASTPTTASQAASIARDTLQALVETGAGLDQIKAAAEALTKVTPLSVTELDKLTQGLYSQAVAAENAAARIEAAWASWADVRAWDEAPGSAWQPEGGLPGVPSPVDLLPPEARAEIQPDRSSLPREQLNQILQTEMAERQKLVAGLTEMSTENGPLANFGTQLLKNAAEAVPAFGAALDGFVQAGPIGAIIGFFSELLFSSQPMIDAFEMINEALAPLGDLLATIIAPALKLFAMVVGWVVDGLIAIWNFLFGWLGLAVERKRGDNDPDPGKAPQHSDDPPPAREMDFGRVSPAVQLAVATPLLEAAQLQLTAASLLESAATGLAGSANRFGEWVDRLIEDGIRVRLEQGETRPTSATAYLR